jgi:hypothetical protein
MFGTAESLSLAFSLDDFVMGNRLLHLVIWFDFIFDFLVSCICFLAKIFSKSSICQIKKKL